MKKLVALLLTLLLIYACNEPAIVDHKKATALILKKIKISGFSFRVPSGYQIHYTDSVNKPGEGYLVSNCAKMYFSGEGFGNIDIINKNNYEGYTVIQDTSGNVLKMVAYKYDSIPHLEVHVVRLNKQDVSGLFGTSNALSKHNYLFVFNAMTNMGSFQPTCMTKDEMNVLVKEFINGAIEK